MERFYQEIKVGVHSLMLGWDENHASVVMDGQTQFNYLDVIVSRVTELSDPRYIAQFTIIANFMFNGLEYEVIEDPQKFDQNYKRILKENFLTANYGVFDTRVIDLPRLQGSQVTFYVEQLCTGVPFRVTCPFPYVDRTEPFAYINLPYRAETTLTT